MKSSYDGKKENQSFQSLDQSTTSFNQSGRIYATDHFHLTPSPITTVSKARF